MGTTDKVNAPKAYMRPLVDSACCNITCTNVAVKGQGLQETASLLKPWQVIFNV